MSDRSGHGAITALLVDDDADYVDVAARAIERASTDLEVRTETDPGAVLGRIEGEGIDCVVSDYRMPGTTGIELLEAIRERFPDLPFVLFTAWSVEDVGEAALEAGVTDYLRKTPGVEQYPVLAHQIEHAVARRRAEERLAEGAGGETGGREATDVAEVIEHDLRGALAGARGALALAEGGEAGALEDLGAALDRIERILDDELARLREGASGRATLGEAARRAWPEGLDGGARLEVVDDAVVEASPGDLRALLRNLFDNAIEHGGASTVRVGALDGEGFYVEDDGSGIPPAERERAFERGYSTDGGRGLAIVDRIAGDHGWDASVREGPSGGARIVFRRGDREG